MPTQYTPLTSGEKTVAEPSGLLPSGEANYFDVDVQGLVGGTAKFRSPTDDGTFVDSITNNLYEFQESGYLLFGGANSALPTSPPDFALRPSGLVFEVKDKETG